MASRTSSTTKPKSLLTTGQTTDRTCNYYKEKGHMVKDCEKLKKKKEKEAQQGKSTQKKTYPKCEPVARLITLKKVVGKGQVRISNPNAPDVNTLQAVTQIQRYKSPSTMQHHPTPSLLPNKTTQKTSFATIPLRPTCFSPTIDQIGISNKNFS